jgi:imidazolonepropionase-like amidohydrolase
MMAGHGTVPAARSAGEQVVIIRAARLFDGMSGSSLRKPSVLVEDGRITDISQSCTVDVIGVNIIDLGDATLMPGLIDCHQHLVFDASDDPVGRLASREDDDVLEGARLAARSALVAGITTVRDLGDRRFVLTALREQLADDVTAGPELLVAGPPITTPRGHCWFLGGEARGLHEVRDAVRVHAAQDVDVIKVMVTGGALTPGSANHKVQYGSAELAAIADQAHHLGLTVTGHAKNARGMSEAVRAGFDGIEHGLFLAPVPDPAVIDAIASTGTYVSVTAAFKPLPERTPQLREKEAAFAMMRAAGVRLILTSDAGINPSVPHDALPYGVVRLPHIGMTNTESLRAVTSAAASACGVEGRKGRIAPGYDADIIAVSGDPLADLTALLRVTAVFRRGIQVR